MVPQKIVHNSALRKFLSSHSNIAFQSVRSSQELHQLALSSVECITDLTLAVARLYHLGVDVAHVSLEEEGSNCATAVLHNSCEVVAGLGEEQVVAGLTLNERIIDSFIFRIDGISQIKSGQDDHALRRSEQDLFKSCFACLRESTAKTRHRHKMLSFV